MHEPIFQAWRTITPKEGEPIPAGAEYRLWSDWYRPCKVKTFDEETVGIAWRAPVEVVPESVAVGLIQQIARQGFFDTFGIYPSDARFMERLSELVVTKLRERSQESGE